MKVKEFEIDREALENEAAAVLESLLLPVDREILSQMPFLDLLAIIAPSALADLPECEDSGGGHKNAS